MKASTTHLLLIPSYNTGPTVFDTVRAARAHWNPVWVVTDGSTDGTPAVLRQMVAADSGLQLIAHMAGVPIQTVFIEAGSPYLSKGWPIWRTPQFPVVFSARLGRRFAPEADHHGLLKRLEAYFAEELRR